MPRVVQEANFQKVKAEVQGEETMGLINIVHNPSSLRLVEMYLKLCYAHNTYN